MNASATSTHGTSASSPGTNSTNSFAAYTHEQNHAVISVTTPRARRASAATNPRTVVVATRYGGYMDVPSSCMALCNASSHRANISACKPSAAPKARGEIFFSVRVAAKLASAAPGATRHKETLSSRKRVRSRIGISSSSTSRLPKLSSRNRAAHAAAPHTNSA